MCIRDSGVGADRVKVAARARVLEEQTHQHGDDDRRPYQDCLLYTSLSSMLRYMADYTSEQVSLQEDIANMRDYLDLMKVRYEEHFSYVLSLIHI